MDGIDENRRIYVISEPSEFDVTIKAGSTVHSRNSEKGKEIQGHFGEARSTFWRAETGGK